MQGAPHLRSSSQPTHASTVLCCAFAGALDHRRHDAVAYVAVPGGGVPGDSANGSEHTDFEEETYVFDCPCGITHDDGELMIECEGCKAWAHFACLQAHMVRRATAGCLTPTMA